MNVTAIVLAGGRSRRFGSDKLAAELDGASLLSRTIVAVKAIADDVIVAGPELPGAFRAGDVPVALVHDPEPFGGPLPALVNVLGTASPDPVADLAIIVGGDMPALVPAVLELMLDRLARDPALDAVILDVPGAPRRQVLPLALRTEHAARVAPEVLHAGDRSLRGLVDRLRTLELPVREWQALDAAGDTLTDVDTRADLDRLRSREAERERRR